MTGRNSKPLIELEQSQKAALRSRSAPIARDTSDVSRFRGLALAAAVAAAAVVAVVAGTAGGAALGSPGPLSRSHERAGLECKSCHSTQAPAKACSGCHGTHASLRSGHRALRERGELGCPTCHAAHASERLVFEPNGSVVDHAYGASQRLDVAIAFRPSSEVTVPVVRVRSCAACHDADKPTDPIGQCLIAGQAELGPSRPVVCFDEHREVAESGKGTNRAHAVPPERDAAWEAARAVLGSTPAPPAHASLLRPVGWLGSALVVSLVALVATRRFGRRKASTGSAAPKLLAAGDVVRLPQIDATTCLGCYACVDACPYDVLEVRRYVAVVARPDACCGLTLCEQRCPNGSLVVRQGEAAPDRPRVAETLESLDVAGIYLAGDLTGVPLIRNAINQGASAVRAACGSLSGIARKDAGVVDVAIVGAGPAGISAALEAKATGLSSAVLEQGSVAESIRSFPRGKLVFDQPLGMPLVGELWLDECTKEELLGKWLRIVRRTRLSIEEGTRVVSIERRAGGPPLGHFELGVESAEGARTVAARRVILATGRRGSPRKLDVEIPDSMLDRVHYSLADARSFAGARVVVVGLGDVAMETAIALARQPDTNIVVSYRGEAFRRGKARNIDEMRRLIEKGRIELVWRSRVTRVDDGGAVLATANGESRVDADALFVMIGAIVPWELLTRVGVRRSR